MQRPRSTQLDSVEGSQEFTDITSMLWQRLRGMQHDLGNQVTAVPGAA
jgi:hypothetical protein